MRIKQLFLMLALLCAVVQGMWAQASWDEVYAMTETKASDWTQLNAGSTTGQTLGTAGTTTYYHVTGDLEFSNSTAGGSGLTILGTVYLFVPSGVTITCTGANASGQTVAGAGIELAEGNTLNLLGSGTVNATGGNAANGGNGTNGSDASCKWDDMEWAWVGGNGHGGNGGGGAGAGIGTRGGTGGAGKPYIVKWAKADDYMDDDAHNIVDPVFNGVTISNATANVETAYVDFVGCYSPVSIYTADKTNLYLGDGNTLYYPTATGFKVNACRGYFQLKQGLKASDSADPNAGVRTFVLNFGGDDNETGIITTNFTNPTNADNAWYTLDGRKLNGRSAEGRLQGKKPTRAGVYINNGKKVVIK